MSNSTANRETLKWMDIDELEAKLASGKRGSLTATIRKVNETIADDIVRNRQREAADFADAQNQIVGHEVTR